MNIIKSIGGVFRKLTGQQTGTVTSGKKKKSSVKSRREYDKDTPAKSYENDDWLDSNQAAMYLGVSCRTVQRLRANKILPFYMMSNKAYHRFGDVKNVGWSKIFDKKLLTTEELEALHKAYRDRDKRVMPHQSSDCQ